MKDIEILEEARRQSDDACIWRQGKMPQAAVRNPQTVAFLEMLGLPYDLDPAAVAVAAAGPIAGQQSVLG